MRLGGEAESPLEKLQVDSGPGAEEGLPQTVSLRWTDFQHACECRLRRGHNSNRVADLHDWFQSGRVAGAVHGHLANHIQMDFVLFCYDFATSLRWISFFSPTEPRETPGGHGSRPKDRSTLDEIQGNRPPCAQI